MTFKLLKKSTGATLTKFHIVDGRGDIVGSINVANEQASDLQKHWREPGAPAAAVWWKVVEWDWQARSIRGSAFGGCWQMDSLVPSQT